MTPTKVKQKVWAAGCREGSTKGTETGEGGVAFGFGRFVFPHPFCLSLAHSLLPGSQSWLQGRSPPPPGSLSSAGPSPDAALLFPTRFPLFSHSSLGGGRGLGPARVPAASVGPCARAARAGTPCAGAPCAGAPCSKGSLCRGSLSQELPVLMLPVPDFPVPQLPEDHLPPGSPPAP